jgi:hypothetical protein
MDKSYKRGTERGFQDHVLEGQAFGIENPPERPTYVQLLNPSMPYTVPDTPRHLNHMPPYYVSDTHRAALSLSSYLELLFIT